VDAPLFALIGRMATFAALSSSDALHLPLSPQQSSGFNSFNTASQPLQGGSCALFPAMGTATAMRL
jgi:hypothetical protein